MGTNYYAVREECKHCGKHSRVHIGKASMGWTFCFYATDKIGSYKEWIKYLSKPDIEIRNEYEETVSLKDLKSLIESKKKAKLNHAIEYSDGNYTDKDGHSFSCQEFS